MPHGIQNNFLEMSLVPLQLSNNVFCHAELHYFRGTRPNGIQYQFLGLALDWNFRACFIVNHRTLNSL